MTEFPSSGSGVLSWLASNALPLIIGLVVGGLIGRFAGALFGL